MIKPYRGGTSVHVQGIEIFIPKKPKREFIANHDLPKRKQKFIRTKLPDDWEELRLEEDERKESNSKYRNPTLEVTPTPVWTDVNTNNSTLEYSTNAIVDYANSSDYFLAWNTGKEADFIQHVQDLLLDLPTGGVASFSILNTATNAEAELAIRWSELF